jgi:glucokinase
MNIVFDIGGTNMRVAAAQEGKLGEIKKVPTPQDPKEGIATFTKIVEELRGGNAIVAIAGAFAGRVSGQGVITGANNLLQWEGHNVSELGTTFNVPISAANDCIVVGLGELHRGAGQGYSTLAYVTVSTGVGGAFVVKGTPVLTSPILGDLKLAVGDLEPQISGTAVQKKFGIHPKDLESLEERNKLADILAEGLAEIAEIWKPEVFVIGGSMIVGINPIPLERVREKFTAVPVQMAALGDNGGLMGAMILAEEK